MEFLGRKQEIRRLDVALQRPRSFVVIWGRRRVGKSRLLLEWAHRQNGLYVVVDQSSAPIQRQYFSSAVGMRFAGFEEAEYPNWQVLFRRLDREAARVGWRGPLIIDEFPYLVAAEPEISATMQNWLDSPSRQITVVVSGSSIHMMKNAILNQSSPLYGRATEAFPLNAFRPGFLGEVFPSISPRELVCRYAVFGGMPRYLELASDHGGDLVDAVDDLILDPEAPLHREPDRILEMETPTAMPLRPILDVIGNGAHRLSEIAGRLGRQASGMSASLATLTEMDMIRRETPFGSNPKSGKRSRYQISDPFLRFWFRVVAPNRSLLADAPSTTRRLCWEKHRVSLEAQAWEELCRMAVPHLHRVVPLIADKGPFGIAQRYWYRDDRELDIVAQSLTRPDVILGEAKWRISHEFESNPNIRIGSLPIGNNPVLPLLFTPEVPNETSVKVVDASMVIEALR